MRRGSISNGCLTSTNVEPYALNPDTRKILEIVGPEARQRRSSREQSSRGDPGRRAPSLGGKPVGKNRFYGANDPRRGTGLALGY